MSAIDSLKAIRPEVVESALNNWKKSDLSTRRAVLTGMESALAGGAPDAQTLVGLRRAVEEGTRGVMEIASDIVSVLIERNGTAFSLVRELVASPSAQGRIGALLCTPPNTPDVLASPILGALLKDRSKKVREMAVEWIRRHDLRQHLQLLESMSANESDTALKDYAALVIGLVKNGYYVRRDPEPRYVTIKMEVGVYGGVVDPEAARGLSDREIAERFVASTTRSH